MKFIKCLEADDCIRACIASLVEANPLTIPNWFGNGADAKQAWEECRVYLKTTHKLDIVHVGIPAPDEQFELHHLLAAMGEANPGVAFMVTGIGQSRAHMVIARDGAIVHDPSWTNSGLTAPIDGGFGFPMWRLSFLTPYVA